MCLLRMLTSYRLQFILSEPPFFSQFREETRIESNTDETALHHIYVHIYIEREREKLHTDTPEGLSWKRFLF